MDNLITGDLKNIEHLFQLEHFKFYHHDVFKFIHVPGDLVYILHFASPASPIDYLKIPIQTLKVGSLGIHNCLGLARVKKARVLVASISEVYGDPNVHPQPEEYWGNVNPVGPRGVYDEAKRFQEAMTMAYHTYHGLETRIIRIFNTYGPRMRLNDGRVLPAFIGQALRGEELTMFGEGSQKLISLPLPTDDPKQRKPDITKARSILGWEPKVSRAEGLKIIYDYFKTLSHFELISQHKIFS